MVVAVVVVGSKRVCRLDCRVQMQIDGCRSRWVQRQMGADADGCTDADECRCRRGRCTGPGELGGEDGVRAGGRGGRKPPLSLQLSRGMISLASIDGKRPPSLLTGI